ncbi:hypothetical protein IEQ34_022376 [Dendrobium chrysotoxum]|uniref:DC-UbP/UBTD2 N-terminal domain-containing protein n=1 Tax=Dendrobium chrysotoxum TaxID=161865 RepID=A0AAV7FWY0_DENCH|nr:hypothetical protein IEQ34_022376 [Dendrobium chrysotoxum]
MPFFLYPRLLKVISGDGLWLILAEHVRSIAQRFCVYCLTENTKKIQKPKPWKNPQPLAMTDLRRMREEFWDTAPHYGGQKEIWDALRAAAEADINLAQAILDSAGVILANADMTLVYDERGKQLSHLKS